MNTIKRIGLVAHDNQKKELVAWVDKHSVILSRHKLVCTGTTGRLVTEMLRKKHPDIDVDIKLLKSGPLGGDQQLGAMISNQEIDFMIFLTDPMTPQPHDVDVKALIRVAIIYNIVMACNITTADFVISSPFFEGHYAPAITDYSRYIGRKCD